MRELHIRAYSTLPLIVFLSFFYFSPASADCPAALSTGESCCAPESEQEPSCKGGLLEKGSGCSDSRQTMFSCAIPDGNSSHRERSISVRHTVDAINCPAGAT